MIDTGLSIDLNDTILGILNRLKNSFECYLPDEKLSQLWQETEVISTEFADFEAVYFEQEFEGGMIFVSEEFEFFPIYMLYLMTIHGAPNVVEFGAMPEYDLVGIDKGTRVLQLGFCNTGSQNTLRNKRIDLGEVAVGSTAVILKYAQGYLIELQDEI